LRKDVRAQMFIKETNKHNEGQDKRLKIFFLRYSVILSSCCLLQEKRFFFLDVACDNGIEESGTIEF